jgi:PPOX class probable F420-dependent enzyme
MSTRACIPLGVGSPNVPAARCGSFGRGLTSFEDDALASAHELCIRGCRKLGCHRSTRVRPQDPHAVLATMKRDGAPQLSPVLVGVDSQDRLVVSTRESAMKTLNVRRYPRAWLCVLNDRFFGDWAQLSGDVQVVSLPEAMEPLVEYYRAISGEHPDWDDYRAAMIKQRRCLIRITPTKAGPTFFG